MDSNPDSHWQKNIFSNVSGFIVICLLGGTKAYLKLNMGAGKSFMEPGCLTSLGAGTRKQEPRHVNFCLLSQFSFSPSLSGMVFPLCFPLSQLLLS